MDLCLIDRLKILNYDEELRKEIKMKPMSRYYFLTSGNSGEQFHIFTSLAAWLLRKIGKAIEQPQEDDDPNFTISSILESMRELDISVDFSPNKLKQGYGEYVVYVLEKLTERALKVGNLQWKPLEMISQEENNVELGEGTMDDDQDVEEEEQTDAEEEIYSEDSEDGVYMNGLKNNDDDDDRISGNLAYDDNLWFEEVEKVAPALRIRIAPSARDWRAHLQQLTAHQKDLSEKAAAVGTGLNKISSGVVRVLEATQAREKLLASRVPLPLVNLKSQYEKTLSSYKMVNTGVTQRQEILNELTEKVESVKQKTEMKGSAMNDTSPIVNIKKAVVALRKEVQQMDLQLAVLMWTVIDKQSKVKKNIPMEQIT